MKSIPEFIFNIFIPVRFTRYDDVSNDWPQQNQRGRGYRVQNASCPWPKVGRKKEKTKAGGRFGRNNPLENDWSSGNYLVHNDIPKVLQQKIVRFLQNQPLGLTILNLRMCDLNTTIPPHTGFARVSLFSFTRCFLRYALKQQAVSVGSRVPLLELLSQQLHGELHLERYRHLEENAIVKVRSVLELMS